jgi:hypothetical protein
MGAGTLPNSLLLENIVDLFHFDFVPFFVSSSETAVAAMLLLA